MLNYRHKRARLFLIVAAALCGVLTALVAFVILQSPAGASPLAPASAGAPILLFGTATLCLLGALAFRAYTGKLARVWGTAVLCSLLILVAQGILWRLLDSAAQGRQGVGTAILSAADTESYLKDNLPPGRNPMRVRTGVFVQSFDLIDANTVEAVGYIWQRYTADTPKDLQRGFVLPEAAGGYEVAEAYRARDTRTGEETIGWHFNVRLRQSFPCEKYPFDRQNIGLRMWHRDFNRGAILVPDFDAYADMNPLLLPGVESEFARTGWQNEYACYSYNKIRYNANFGFGTYRDRPPLPELYFNVGIKRSPGNILLRRGIPLFVAALLLFGVTLILTRESKWRELSGNDAFAVLAFGAVLFFGLAADHIGLRNALAANTFVYAECGYIILYLLLLLVSAGAYLLSARRKVSLVEYEDGAAIPLLFWPLVLGLLLIGTTLTFAR